MSANANYRIQQWKQPPRPEWVRRVNEEGSYLDLKSVVPLDEQSLIATAKANTGLSDFGVADWHEPFQRFIKSLDEEAELNLMGRLMTRSDILMYLEARLRVEEEYKRHPEIDAEELAPQVLIVGSGRSGTSAIQNLLSFDRANGTPKHWEALFPAPPPEAETYHSDPRIALADQRMTQWNRVTPEMASIHEFNGDMPTELIQLEALSFQATGWLIFCGLTPSFDAWMANRSGVPGLSYAKRVMKLLQWKNPRTRWMLKSPDAMRYLPDVFKVFPDLQLVWMHRDPLKVVSSGVSLVGTILWVRSDRPMDPRAIAQLTHPSGLKRHFDRVLDQIDAGQVPAEQIRHVQYLDFVADPMGTVEKLYRELNMPLTAEARAAMENYLREHPRESRPAHKYSDADEAQRATEYTLFERYLTRFDVKTES